jgi:hypothetical protein
MNVPPSYSAGINIAFIKAVGAMPNGLLFLLNGFF